MKGVDRTKIGEKLIQLRGNRRREAVANALDISVSTLTLYELGQRTPRDPIKIKLADYYGVNVGDLFYKAN